MDRVLHLGSAGRTDIGGPVFRRGVEQIEEVDIVRCDLLLYLYAFTTERRPDRIPL
jgi:hypothetical protein